MECEVQGLCISDGNVWPGKSLEWKPGCILKILMKNWDFIPKALFGESQTGSDMMHVKNIIL